MGNCIIFARAALGKHLQPGSLKNGNLFSCHSGGQKFKIKVGLISSQPPFLDSQIAVFLCAHMVFSVHIYDQISFLCEHQLYILSGLTSRPHLTLIASLKALSPNSHILRGWGLKPQHMNGGGVGQTVQPHKSSKERKHTARSCFVGHHPPTSSLFHCLEYVL